MMDQLISRFTVQLREAISLGENISLAPLDTTISHVYVAGMGGSGIGAEYVSTFIAEESLLPYLTGKRYDVPAYVGPETLFIASSYSGNTEETLTATGQAAEAGARIICISSGGKLGDFAQQGGYAFVRVPGDWPSPRACLGYSVVLQLSVLVELGVISNIHINHLRDAIALIEKDQDDIRTKADKIARFIHKKTPVIYATDRFAPVCVRFRQQLNENAKMLAWHHVLPEMNHNELVGWRDIQQDKAVIFLRSRDDLPRNKVRTDITKQIIGQYTDTVLEIYAKGRSLIAQSIYLTHLVDWVSWYLAELRGMDAVEVQVIDFLKGELGNMDNMD